VDRKAKTNVKARTELTRSDRDARVMSRLTPRENVYSSGKRFTSE
jgi:hypothetical protein